MGYFLAALFLICQSVFLHYAHAAAAPSKLIIGYAAMSARVVPLWIAEEQGILAKYGVNSEPVFIRGAPTLVAGLTSGDIHFGNAGSMKAASSTKPTRCKESVLNDGIGNN